MWDSTWCSRAGKSSDCTSVPIPHGSDGRGDDSGGDSDRDSDSDAAYDTVFSSIWITFESGADAGASTGNRRKGPNQRESPDVAREERWVDRDHGRWKGTCASVQCRLLHNFCPSASFGASTEVWNDQFGSVVWLSRRYRSTVGEQWRCWRGFRWTTRRSGGRWRWW